MELVVGDLARDLATKGAGVGEGALGDRSRWEQLTALDAAKAEGDLDAFLVPEHADAYAARADEFALGWLSTHLYYALWLMTGTAAGAGLHGASRAPSQEEWDRFTSAPRMGQGQEGGWGREE